MKAFLERKTESLRLKREAIEEELRLKKEAALRERYIAFGAVGSIAAMIILFYLVKCCCCSPNEEVCQVARKSVADAKLMIDVENPIKKVVGEEITEQTPGSKSVDKKINDGELSELPSDQKSELQPLSIRSQWEQNDVTSDFDFIVGDEETDASC